jgi:hypothetical protein
MVQRGDRPSLALEACLRIEIVSAVSRQDLDRDRAVEACVAGFVDLGHPACAERAQDFIRTEPRAGIEGHALNLRDSFERRL